MKTDATVDASVDAGGELSGSKASTSTMNLVVWIDDPERRNWVLERAELLAEKHPSCAGQPVSPEEEKLAVAEST